MSGFNHTQDPIWTMGGERTDLELLIGCNGSSPTVLDTNIPGGVTVTRTGAGTYQAVINSGALPNASLAKVSVDIGNNAAAVYGVVYDSTALGTTGTLKFYTSSAGSAADLASPAQLSVLIRFKNTGVPRP